MRIFNLKLRTIPHSIMMQLQALNDAEIIEVDHEVIETRELTPHEFKKVNQFQQWATRQRNAIYDEINPTVKDARK